MPCDDFMHTMLGSLLREYVSIPSHVLPDLPKVAHEGYILGKPGKSLQVDTQISTKYIFEIVMFHIYTRIIQA